MMLLACLHYLTRYLIVSARVASGQHDVSAAMFGGASQGDYSELCAFGKKRRVSLGDSRDLSLVQCS